MAFSGRVGLRLCRGEVIKFSVDAFCVEPRDPSARRDLEVVEAVPVAGARLLLELRGRVFESPRPDHRSSGSKDADVDAEVGDIDEFRVRGDKWSAERVREDDVGSVVNRVVVPEREDVGHHGRHLVAIDCEVDEVFDCFVHAFGVEFPTEHMTAKGAGDFVVDESWGVEVFGGNQLQESWVRRITDKSIDDG